MYLLADANLSTCSLNTKVNDLYTLSCFCTEFSLGLPGRDLETLRRISAGQRQLGPSDQKIFK
jgi:hypothetical protein